MLTEHFNLRVQPFGVTPDARFLYLGQTHREAIASLLYGIHSGRGFTALIAAPGMGKTTLLFHLLGLLIGNARTAFLFQTLCGPEEFLRSLLADLAIEDEGGDITRMHAKLNAYLLKESKSGRQVVVVIDEAQNLDERVLELVRMLSNFETPGKKLMHLVLAGQPQLAKKLTSARLTQLRQRISIVARLAPFDGDQTREYIEHRLRVAGLASGKQLFSRQAYEMIAEQSCGIPRDINNLCFNSMSLACALKRPEVDVSMVREAINDLDLTTIALPEGMEVRRRAVKQPAPLLSLRKYVAAAAIVSVVAFGLFIRNWSPSPSNDRIRPEQATSSPPQSTTGSHFEAGPASDVSVQEEGIQRVHEPQGRLQTNTGSATSAFHPPTAIAAVPLRTYTANPSQESGGTRVSDAHVNDFQTATRNLELAPMPEDLERLRHSLMVQLSLAQQVREKEDAAPEQNPVPLGPALQREKP